MVAVEVLVGGLVTDGNHMPAGRMGEHGRSMLRLALKEISPQSTQRSQSGENGGRTWSLLETVEDVEVRSDAGVADDIAFEIERKVWR